LGPGEGGGFELFIFLRENIFVNNTVCLDGKLQKNYLAGQLGLGLEQVIFGAKMKLFLARNCTLAGIFL
jgi:hypothetical protein